MLTNPTKPLLQLLGISLCVLLASSCDERPKQTATPVFSVTDRAAAKPALANTFRAKLERKLRTIVFDEISHEDISVARLLAELSARSRQLDPEGTGVNIVWIPPRPEYEEDDEGWDDDDDDDDGWGDNDAVAPVLKPAQKYPTTLEVHNIPLREALYWICKCHKLTYTIMGNAVIVAPEDIPLRRFKTRAFPLPQEDADILTRDIDGNPVTIETHMTRRGITFPKGSQTVYDKLTSCLFVTNTPDNLERIAELLRPMCIEDPMALVETRLVRIPEADYVQLKAKHNSTRDQLSFWHFLLQSSKAETLFANSVLTMNGQQAELSLTTDTYFPEEWDPLYADGSTQQRSNTVTPFGPQFGDSTPLGALLDVTPSIDADHYTIRVDGHATLSQQIGWTKLGTHIKMPRLKTWESKIDQSLYDGATTCISRNTFEGEAKEPNKSNRVVYLQLLTVRLIWADGSFVRDLNDKAISLVAPPTPKQTKPLPEHNTRGLKSKLENKLDAIVFDHLRYENATISTVCADLHRKTKLLDADREGVNIMLNIDKQAIEYTPTITTDLKAVTLRDILDYVNLFCNTEYRVEERAVILGSSGCFCGPDTWFIPLSSSKYNQLLEASKKEYGNLPQGEASGNKALAAYFTRRGVPFYDGWSNMAYDRSCSTLIASLYSDDRERFQNLLTFLTTTGESMVEIDCQIYEISDEGQASLFAGPHYARFLENRTAIPGSVLTGLLQSSQANLLASATLLTRTDQTVISPGDTRLDISSPSTDAKTGKDDRAKASEIEELGFRLELCPYVAEDRDKIALYVDASIRKLTGRSEYGTGNDAKRKPIINNLHLETNVKTTNQQTVFCGRIRMMSQPQLNLPTNASWEQVHQATQKHGGKYRNIYIFITPRLVRPGGSPLPKYNGTFEF